MECESYEGKVLLSFLIMSFLAPPLPHILSTQYFYTNYFSSKPTPPISLSSCYGVLHTFLLIIVVKFVRISYPFAILSLYHCAMCVGTEGAVMRGTFIVTMTHIRLLVAV